MKKFKRIFVVEPAHDISLLGKYADEIILLSDPEIPASCLFPEIGNKLQDYNSEEDALVPMGRVSACTMAGMAVAFWSILNFKKFGIQKVFISIGIFLNGDYTFERIELE